MPPKIVAAEEEPPQKQLSKPQNGHARTRLQTRNHAIPTIRLGLLA